MVDVAIYRAVSKGFFVEEVENRIPNIDSVDEARMILLELYETRVDNPEWNVKESWISETYLEAHVIGYCRDEHYMLVIEDPGSSTAMEAHNDRLKAQFEMEELDN
mgnify:CR=1 FL=1